MALKFIQNTKTTLAGSGCTSTATSIILSDLKLPDGVTAITTVDLGDKCLGTIEPGTSKEEQISFTGVTANGDGTYTLTGVTRGLRFVSPYDEVTANKFAHAGGVMFIISNTAGFYAQIKEYIDNLSVNGSVPATDAVPGIGIVATQAQVDAGTATETYSGTPYSLFPTPDQIRAKKYHDYAADAGSTDAYAITITPAITAYSAGQEFTFKANTANTGACTLAVSGLSAIALKKNYNEDLATGDILANQIVTVVYDGTNMQIKSHLPLTMPIVRTYLAAASPATWTKPTGLRYINVKVQGAGGNGANSTGSVTGGGGGGGAYTEKNIPASSLGSTETVTIGAAGVGSGNTSFGSHCTAGNGTNASGATNGTGGTATGGDININGQDGEAGNAGTPALNAGSGGNSYLGKAGVRGGNQTGTFGSANGQNGFLGGGGGGATSATDGSPTGTGGIGGIAFVTVTEFY